MIIKERQAIAAVTNFGKYPVIGLDLDKDSSDKFGSYIIGSNVRVAWDREGKKWEGMTSRCQLVIENGRYCIDTSGAFLTADFTVNDFVEDIENANTPLIHREQIVSVAHYSKERGEKYVRMMKVAPRINTTCMEVTHLEDLDPEEEKEVNKYIEEKKRW